jgi:predicted Zn-dependent protease
MLVRAAVPLAFALLVIGLSACEISEDDEVALGRQYAEQVEQQLPLVTDPAIREYVESLGESIARTTSRRDLAWRFAVVDSREVNAFAIPGGFIYVNRGIIERADDVSELAGVLGHEIGHVVRRHSVEQMKKARNTNVGVGIVCMLVDICSSGAAQVAINVGGQAVFARFSRGHEAEADSEAVVNVVAAGIDPDGVPRFFDELLAAREREPGLLDGFFGTHPLEESRVEATRAHIRRLEAARGDEMRRLIRDTPNFQAFRQRVLSLPPPPPARALPQGR